LDNYEYISNVIFEESHKLTFRMDTADFQLTGRG